MKSNSAKAKFDLILVGAGPCGLAAAAQFKQAGLNYIHLESGFLSQTIINFPRKIRLYSKRAALEIGGVPFPPHPEEPPTREEYIDYLKRVARKLDLKVMTHTDAESIHPGAKKHLLKARTSQGKIIKWTARHIVIASGGYYSPTLLDIPGENNPNVSHYFDSEQPVHGKTILVVGGRNSALEAAITLAQKQAKVILAYRGSRLPRSLIKPWLLPQLDKS